jgi:6-phosphogluconolactonase (cycloisomerase 2 family)
MVADDQYVGGTAVFFPTDPQTHALSADSESPILEFDFTYEKTEAPNSDRQDTAHLHQIVEGSNGTLYMPDLGSDRIWIVKREGASGLKTHGYLTAPPGAGPRHLVISPDGKCKG